MMTVRFATGFSIQYNTAVQVNRRAEYTDLYSDYECKKWVAQVPTAGCVIEAVPACRSYFAGGDEITRQINRDLQETSKSVRSLTRKIGKVTR